MSETSRALEDVAGFVLAGGRSSRMGREKALVELNGRPLIAHALRIFDEAGIRASIAGSWNAGLAQFAPVIPDKETERGPLAGICAALASTTAPLVVFLSVDAPLIPASLIRSLLQHARESESPVTFVSVGEFAQTFPAVVHRRAMPALEAALHSSNLGCYAAFQSAAEALNTALSILPVERLVESATVVHPAALSADAWFSNINTPEDLERIASLLHGRSALS